MSFLNTINSNCKLLCAALGIACINCSYADMMYDVNHEALFFYKDSIDAAEDNFFDTEFVPVRLMSDEALLMAAEAERDSSMTRNQRVLNCRWLASNDQNTFTGGKAFREFFKKNAMRLFKSEYSSLTSNRLTRSLSLKDTFINSKSSYSLDVGNDRVLLKYKYWFNL